MAQKVLKFFDFCESCRKKIENEDAILYVEEDRGRVFCSEQCIEDFYDPIAEDLYEQVIALRNNHDINEDQFFDYEKYLNICLEKPDEIWCEESESGEFLYYFISSHSDEGGQFHYIVISFCIEFEPTFVILSIPTRDKNFVNVFRRGKKIDIDNPDETIQINTPIEAGYNSAAIEHERAMLSKSQAIEEEMFRYRKLSDIPKREFDKHYHLLEDTIENPDEAWEIDDQDVKMLTLINHQDSGPSYIVLCIYEVGEGFGENWRVLYSFPTNDPDLVQHFRRGELSESLGEKYEFIH